MIDKSALLASAQPVDQSISLADGTAFAVQVREVNDADWMRYAAVSISSDPDVQAGARAFLISKGYVDTDGKPALTIEEAAKLKPHVARQIVKHIIALNQPDPARLGNA